MYAILCIMRKTILFSSYMSASAGRRHLAGVFRFIAEKGRDWEVFPVKLMGSMTKGQVAQLLENSIDGAIVAGGLKEDLLTDMMKKDTPIIEIEGRHLPAKARTFLDEEAVGHLAAEHLISFGNFATFGYVPYSECTRWSYLRMKGFTLTLSKRGRRALVKGPKTDLVTWLKRLQKPAAVFCACDMTADDVLHAAVKAKIRVPQDLSVLGVDDDELYCDNMRPALSSVRPGHEDSGYAAAELLDLIFRGKKAKDRIVPPKGVTSRDSVSACLPAKTLVERAAHIIDEHADDGWSVDEVAEALHVSRRLLSLRYAQLKGQSVHAALTDRRLKEVERLLKSTKTTITGIVKRAGFGNANHLKRLFKSRYGKTMREWRNRGDA